MRVLGRITAGIALAIGCSLNAYAADLGPARHAAVAAPAPGTAPLYNWGGFYVGANAGYSWGHARTDYTLDGVALTTTSVSPNGFVGGGQFGYNWQLANTVLGIEGDLQGSGQKGDGSFAFTALAIPFTGTYTSRVDWFSTVRARAGYASDRWLWYVTGGWAHARGKTDGSVTGGGVTTPFSGSDNLDGWTAGVGVEAALYGNWTWKAEYLYVDFGKLSESTPTAIGTFASSTKVTDNLLRLGLNYRF